MTLSNALPTQELLQRFPDLSIVKYSNDLPAISLLKGPAMFSMGLSIWDIIVSRRPDLNPLALSKYVDACDHALPRRIGNLLGKRIIFDAYYEHCSIELNQEKMTVAETLVAHVYPNHLHIADIEFSDPHRPIPENQRVYEYKNYEGLGLLSSFLDNIEIIARQLGCESITLVAASNDLYRLFSRHGFAPSNTQAGIRGMQAGRSIPMEKTA